MGTICASPVATIHGSHTHLEAPSSLATYLGKLYVLNAPEDSFGNEHAFITVYSPNASGNASPVATISGWPDLGNALAVGSTGKIYVA